MQAKVGLSSQEQKELHSGQSFSKVVLNKLLVLQVVVIYDRELLQSVEKDIWLVE